MGRKNQKLNLEKDILYKYYIEDKLSPREIGELLNCTTKSVRNYLMKYKIPLRTMSESIVISSAKRSEDVLRERALKFRNTWYSRPENEREEINKSRKTKSENLEQALKKSMITKMNRNSGTKSRSEDGFYHLLCNIFGKEDIIRQYFDERYPFNCDFYIKSKDLFIEYQGHPSHGYCPFNKDDKECIEFLNKQTIDMTTWTIRDIKKINVARNSGIRLVLIYPKHSNYLIENNKTTTFQSSELEKI